MRHPREEKARDPRARAAHGAPEEPPGTGKDGAGTRTLPMNQKREGCGTPATEKTKGVYLPWRREIRNLMKRSASMPTATFTFGWTWVMPTVSQ